MTPATAQSLSFGSEGNAGNTDQNFRELFAFAVERLQRIVRLEDSIGAADELGAIANPPRDYRASCSVDARIEDRAPRLQRVSQDTVGRDFVAESGIEDDGRGVAVERAREQMLLDDQRRRRRALSGERVAACDHDRAKIFLFIRHSRCHGGSGSNCSSIAPFRRRHARVSLSFSNRLTAGLYPRNSLSRKPSLRLKNVARASCW